MQGVLDDPREETELPANGKHQAELAESLKRKRDPILWKGKMDSEAVQSDVEGGDAGPPGSPKRLRPNPTFLTGFVSSIKRANQRLIAEATANAACKELTAVAASGAKIQFDRIPQDEPEKFRRVALTTACQQNLANCVALLKEVAAHYGYSLDISQDLDGDASDQKDANGVQQPEGDSLAMEEEEVGDDTDDQEGAGKVNWSHSESLGVRPLRSMQARLYIQHDGQEFKHRERPPVQQNPEAQPRPAPVAPSLTKNNRLANTALAALGGPSALRPAHNILKPRPSKGAATASNLMRHDVQQDQSLSWVGDEDALPSCTISRDPDMSGDDAEEEHPRAPVETPAGEMSSGRDEQDSVAETSNEAEEDMLMHPWTKSGLKADRFLQKLQPMQGSQLPPKAITSGGRQRLTAGRHTRDPDLHCARDQETVKKVCSKPEGIKRRLSKEQGNGVPLKNSESMPKLKRMKGLFGVAMNGLQ